MISPQRAIVTLVFLLSLCAFSPHAFADRSIELFLQLGHTSLVWLVAFSPDGTRLASGSNDQTLSSTLGGGNWLAKSFLSYPPSSKRHCPPMIANGC